MQDPSEISSTAADTPTDLDANMEVLLRSNISMTRPSKAVDRFDEDTWLISVKHLIKKGTKRSIDIYCLKQQLDSSTESVCVVTVL